MVRCVRKGSGIALALACALLIVACGDGESTSSETTSAADLEAAAASDAEAKAAARTAQVVMEAFAVDNVGSYEGADVAVLTEGEPALAEAELDVVDASSTGYTVTATSEIGTAFSVTRDENGKTTYSCTPAGADAGCPESGDWSTG